ncbi:MAG TPA: hypothetical protein VE219_02805 [Candidatus Sulfotelmatobacter sp.]|nr:hypothetical protein [Candidatus Sulfotelmatobacter sp.]
MYGYLPGADAARFAALLGSTRKPMERSETTSTRTRASARELLETPSFAGRVDRLSFWTGDTVIGAISSLAQIAPLEITGCEVVPEVADL